jgi:hypothetical protein
MRIQGRILRASNLAERRVLKSLGTDVLRVPRKLNPFAVARHIRKIASGTGGNLPQLRAALAKAPARQPSSTGAPTPFSPNAPDMPVVPTLPDSTSEPREARAA